MAIRKLVARKLVKEKTLSLLVEQIAMNKALGKESTAKEKELKRVSDA